MANTVIVSDTGALLTHTREILKKSTKPRVYVPAFCRSEIEKLAERTGESYQKILNNKKISWYERTEEKERLKVLPKRKVKSRTIGIVYICCKLAEEGFKVILKTNSYEAAKLAEAQKLDIQVVKL